MKKIFVALFMVLLLGCAGSRNYEPVFDHVLIRQVNIKNPSFILAVENDDKNYYLNQLEDAFIRNKITIHSGETNISNTNIEGKSKGVAYSSGTLGVASSRNKSSIASKTIDIENTNATYIYILDKYSWSFKVILSEGREVIMKGYIRNDLDSEVLRMYHKIQGN